MTTWRLGPYRALEHLFVVEGVECEPVRVRLERALAPLAAPSETVAPSAYKVMRMGDPDIELYRLTFGSRLVAKGQSAFHAAGFVLWHVNQRAVTMDRGRRMILHAAGVERNGVLVLLLGDSGVGKTTTTAGLLRAGFRYLTDEAVALDRVSLKATVFPKALALNADVSGMFDHRRSPAGRVPRDPVRHLTWQDLGSPGLTGGIAPRLIVSLAKPDAAAGLKAGSWGRVSSADMTLTLAQSTFRFRSRPRQNLKAAAALAETASAYLLRTGDVDQSVAAVGSWVASIASDSPEPDARRPIEPMGGSRSASESVGCDPQARYRPVAGLTVLRAGDSLVLRHSDSGQSAVLGGTGLAVWQRLTGRSTLDHVVEQLAHEYSRPVRQVRPDVESLVSTLLGLGLVREGTDSH